jgi:hypothetical protein
MSSVDYTQFPNVPPGEPLNLQDDFPSWDAFIVSMQLGMFALEDEIETNCKMAGWFTKTKNHALWRAHNIAQREVSYARATQRGEVVPAPTDLESISDAYLCVWRVGTSLLALSQVPSRLRESRRLTIPEQYAKSEYVLYVARRLALAGLTPEFVSETRTKSPDIRSVCGLEVECKQKDAFNLESLKSTTRKSAAQFSGRHIGLLSIDLLPEYSVEELSVRQIIADAMRDKAASTPKLHFCAVTQTKLT